MPKGALPIMAHTGRLRQKGVPFSGFRFMKGPVSISLVEECQRVGKSVIAVCETQGLKRPNRRILGREKKY